MEPGGLPLYPSPPHRRLAELYISLGFNRHGMISGAAQYACRDISGSHPAHRGTAMVVFNMPSDDLVFKIIRDRFAQPKPHDASEVIAK